MLEAQGYGTRCSFRNATFVPKPIYKETKDGTKVLTNANFLEQCDAVAGDVPALYEGYPSAEEVLEKYEAERKKRLAEVKVGKANKPEPKPKPEPKKQEPKKEVAQKDWEPNK
jgi:hypothetical protein